MEWVHSLLKRQLKRFSGTIDLPPKEWQRFLQAVNDAYVAFDQDRSMLERSLNLSSKELFRANAGMSAVINSSRDGIIAFDHECRYTVWNPGMERMTGVPKKDVLGHTISQIFPVFKEAGEEQSLYASLTGKTIIVKDKAYVRPGTGQRGYFEGYYSPLKNESEEIIGGLAIFRDVTERKAAEETLKNRSNMLLRHQEALLHLAKQKNDDLQSALKIIAETDGKTLNVERVGIWLFNEDFSELVCEDLYILTKGVHEGGMRLQSKDYPRYFHALEESGVIAANDARSDPRTSEFTETYLKPLGIMTMLDVPVWLHGKVAGVVCHEHTGPIRTWCPEERDFSISIADMVSIALETSERKKAQEALAEQAIRDPLTGVYNRRYFDLRIVEEMARADRDKSDLAILLCDLDHFKVINDNLGHQIGDEVLKAVVNCFRIATRGIDLVFRWGGDEIVVILSNITREKILTVTSRIRGEIQKIKVAAPLGVDISIGVALYPEHFRKVDALIRLADRALYIAKKGGDHVHIGEEEYRLDEHSIKVAWQPLVDIATGLPVGYEALSRDAQGKMSITALFNKYNAIGKLNELKCLCFKSQLKLAKAEKLKRVFINVDFRMLNQLDIVPKPAHTDIILEISEGDVLHDISNHLKVVEKWRGAGYQFAIDDFGAGFISFSFIAQMVPDYIKLDRSILLQAVASKQFMKFAGDLTKALRNYTKEGIIAEGVENNKELQVVKKMGVTLVQGYYFGRPDVRIPKIKP